MTDTATRPIIPAPNARFCGTDSDLRAIKVDLEQQRRFRVEQLRVLTASIHRGAPTRADNPQGAVDLALRAAATTVLANIDDALARITTNRYGLWHRHLVGATASAPDDELVQTLSTRAGSDRDQRRCAWS